MPMCGCSMSRTLMPGERGHDRRLQGLSGDEGVRRAVAGPGARPLDFGETKVCPPKNDSGVWGSNFSSTGQIILRSNEQTVDGGWRITAPARIALSPEDIRK